jgi:Kef-type K+ transport system membrane component KefB
MDVELAYRFFLQAAVILLACRLVGWIGKFFGQTQVVGEMVAGVLLGPSLFGLLAPDAQQWLFPKTLVLSNDLTVQHPSMSILFVTSQLGLVLYMFMVGLEFDARILSSRVRTAAWVSVAGIAVPFFLGAAASLLINSEGTHFEQGVSPTIAALFVGAAMSITAFPMLARIIDEFNIANTAVGTLSLAAGAINDALAWCLLAVVLASIKGSPSLAIATIGGGTAFALFMIFVGKPLLSYLKPWFVREGRITSSIAVTVFAVAMTCAWLTDLIGIYSVFGGFIAGACMPKGKFAAAMKVQIEHVTAALLLPIFFVYSGLNTQIGLIAGGQAWLIAGLLFVCAVVGKLLGCTLAAKAGGESWRDAATIGVLMNARGLMELIILNIGLKQGVITPTLFTMLVLMALVTTLMTSPLFKWLHFLRLPVAESKESQPANA